MNPERWQQIKKILVGWEEQCPLEDYLQEACGQDDELKREVRIYFNADSDPLESLSNICREAIHEVEGPFRGGELLGSGLTGQVFLWRNAEAYGGRDIVVKTVPPGRLTEPEGKRINLEGNAFAPLLDVEHLTYEVRFYSSFVAGVDLDSWCRERLNRPALLLDLFIRICRIVADLHEKELALGNIKPGNIRIDEKGNPHLLDVEYALVYKPAGRACRISTENGPAWRFCDYISPEQLQDDPLTRRSDVYTLGLLLYKMLCGATPYSLNEVSSRTARMYVLESEPDALSSFFSLPVPPGCRGLDEQLARQLAEGRFDEPAATALAGNPQQRFEDAGVLAAELESKLGESSG